MNKDIYCPIIHGGLQLTFFNEKLTKVHHCCLQKSTLKELDPNNIWESEKFKTLRKNNLNGIWDKNCWTCKANELSNTPSFRTGMIEKFGEKTNLTGPLRLDLTITNNCNLACRICSPDVSTFWQKHLKDNNLPVIQEINLGNYQSVIKILNNLDLSNLGMVVYCGGETLLGNNYWKITEYLVDNVPNPEENLTICFQTNGTMPIDKKYYKLIEKFHLLKLHISLDGIEDKFEYLRWPAKWNQVVDNIFNLNNSLPVNTMFLIEETNNIFNLFYKKELEIWIRQNFATNRLGDANVHASHLANGDFNLDNITYEYLEALKSVGLQTYIKSDFKENSESITSMIEKINKFDNIRNQDWKKTFPEVAEFYKRYL